MVPSTFGLVLLSLATSILAKTDLAGCTSTRAATGIVYWVPGTGELCQLLDCGGGRAPPKTDVPGCAAYAGNAPYQPTFIPGFGAGGIVTASSETVPTSGLLTDTSMFSTPTAASTTLESIPSPTSTALADTTSTLQTGAAATSLLSASGLLFDTSATTRDATSVISITPATTSASAGPVTATANAAPDSMNGQKLVGALIGLVAGVALI